MRPIALTLLIFSFCWTAVAQDRPSYTCPVITLEGPKRILLTGEVADFTVKADTFGAVLPLQYYWSVSDGKILSGQGTERIVVEQASGPVTLVTVRTAGTPDDTHCPVTNSEMARWARPAAAVKVLSYRGIFFDRSTSAFDHRSAVHETTRLIVFLGHKRDAAENILAKREAEIRKLFGGDLERMSITRVPGGTDVTEVWKVPPGVSLPECEECNLDECPLIYLTGPATELRSGETAEFNVAVSGIVPGSLGYTWTVVGAEIIDGQGTSLIRVSTDRWREMSIRAYVFLTGLPKGCNGSKELRYDRPVDWLTTLIDEYPPLDQLAEKERLNRLDFTGPVGRGFEIWVVFNTPLHNDRRLISSRTDRLRKYFASRKDTGKEVIFFALRPAAKPSTQIYVRPFEDLQPENVEVLK